MLIALFLSAVAGLADVLGGFLSVARKVDHKTLNYFIAISTGFILAVTFTELYPEVIKGLDAGPVLILLGFISIFILENLFAVHAHDDHSHEHEHTFLGKHYEDDKLKQHSVWAAFLGLLIHTFFDGAAISARLLVSPTSGILVFLAVLAHKMPEGFSMASIFQAGGSKRIKSFASAVALGASTVLGAAIVYLTKQTELSIIFLGLAAGSFTYITASELVPFISGTKDRKGILYFLFGVGLYYIIETALTALLH